ncbi:MAG: [NiFe]-hydrogenase assembly chaperone HybE [Xanthobacteraceae bacterium]|nr:[NiFe]-hydrogenase assembly chaperone HybE [Xanthobacteraceae bacterium]
MKVTDPTEFGALLAEHYRLIGERSMRDLPVYNDSLSVEAVGFELHGEVIAGILITPWFMNVVLLPLDDRLASQRPGASFAHGFPVGTLDFTVADIDAVGRIGTCSLFSPMFDFGDIDTARATATAALAEIVSPRVDPAAANGRPASAVDRRSLLRGSLTGART